MIAWNTKKNAIGVLLNEAKDRALARTSEFPYGVLNA